MIAVFFTLFLIFFLPALAIILLAHGLRALGRLLRLVGIPLAVFALVLWVVGHFMAGGTP